MSASRRGALGIGFGAIAASLLAPSARADSGPPRKASSEAFRFCREQEKAGDARACWSVWLQKYRGASNEAELAYAEERPLLPVTGPGARTARLELSSLPGAVVTLDGALLGMLPREAVDVTPGEHRLTFAHHSRIEGRTFTVSAGEIRRVDVRFEAPAAKREPIAEAAAPSAPILDFCAISPRTGVRKERLVTLAPSGTLVFEEDAAFAAADASHVLQAVLPAHFASPHFHNVTTSLAAKSGWEERDTLTLAEVRTFLQAPPPGTRDERTEPASAGHASRREEREKKLVAYSLGCTDYLAIPSITSHEKGPTITMNGALGLFRRNGETFERVAISNETVPSLRTRSPVPAGAAPAVTPSGLPVMRCLFGKGFDAEGLAPCGPTGEGLTDATADVCERAASKATAAAELRSVALACEVRSRSAELARAFRDDLQTVDGWGPPMVLRESWMPSLAVGRAERVKIGDAFEVRDSNDRRTAFYKVARVGSGGPNGESDPSLLRTRQGEAPKGARVDRYAQAGLVLAPYGSVGWLTGSSARTTVQIGDSFQDFALPGPLFGGGATLGYDVSSLVDWNDTFVRVGGGVLMGNGLNTTATLVPIDLWLEHALYQSKRLTFIAAVGATAQLSSVTLLASTDTGTDRFSTSSLVYGPAGRLGLDVFLAPAWSLQVEGVARVPVNAASYTSTDGKDLPAEWRSRGDHLRTVSVNVGLALTL